MSFEDKVVIVLVIYLSYGVILSGCEVVLVNRNVTDSFGVGKDGCKNDSSVCDVPNVAATCQPDTGLCLCPTGAPDFRNPVTRSVGDVLKKGTTYGCVENVFARTAGGSVNGSAGCQFGPFQVIPYSRNDTVTEFYHNDKNITLNNCSFLKAWVKFPDNFTEMELLWLNESYVDLKIRSNYTLDFKWKRSVPDLQGTIITFDLECSLSPSSDAVRRCLEAKVLGTWPADTMGTSPTTPAILNPLAVRIFFGLILFLVMILVVWYVVSRAMKGMKRRKLNRTRNASKPSTYPAVIHSVRQNRPAISTSTNVYPSPKKNENKPKDNGLKYLDTSKLSNVNSKETNGTRSDHRTGCVAKPCDRGSYESKDRDDRKINRKSEGSFGKDYASKPSTSQAVKHSHEDTPAKSTPNIHRTEVNGDLYAANSEKNKNTQKDNGLKGNSTLSITNSKETNGTQSDHPTGFVDKPYYRESYGSKDRDNRKIDHKTEESFGKENASKPSTSPAVKHSHEDEPAKSTPNIQRTDVNADLYAANSEKNENKQKDNGLKYLDPSESNDVNSNVANATQSDHPTGYVDKPCYRESYESKDRDDRTINRKSEESFAKENASEPSTSEAPVTHFHEDAPAKSTTNVQRNEFNEDCREMSAKSEKNMNKRKYHSASNITNSKEGNGSRSDHSYGLIDKPCYRWSLNCN